MKTKPMFAIATAIAAAAWLAAAGLPQRIETRAIAAQTSGRIVDLPTVTVRPAAQDAAYYRARKTVDLAAVVVHADAADHALFLADSALSASLACRC